MNTFNHPVAGILSRCESMGEIADVMKTMEDKRNPPRMEESPATSTAGDSLRNRDTSFFMEVYFMLIEHFKPTLSINQMDNLAFSKLFLFTSNTIRLFFRCVEKRRTLSRKSTGKLYCIIVI